MVQGEGPQGRPGGLQGVGGSGAQPLRAGRPSQRTEVR